MVSTEYPPMIGGVGRYAANLVSRLGTSCEVVIACDRQNRPRNDVYPVIERGNPQTSTNILSLINDCKADIVHVQYERAMYESDNYPLFQIIKQKFSGSILDQLYRDSPVPVVTTLHNFPPPKGELRQHVLRDIQRRRGRFWFLPRIFLVTLEEELVYGPSQSFPQAALYSGGIVHLARVSLDSVRQGTIIYHGAEPAFTSRIDKDKFRDQFHLPKKKMLVLAFGYSTEPKGFDILRKMKLPDDWVLVTKQTRHVRNIEEPITFSNSIALTDDYMDEQTLSRLFFACDALVLPYRSISISGVLFDGLAHGLPFVASDLTFFREFAARGLGILADVGNPQMMTKALEMLSEKYCCFRANVEQFRDQLKWDKVAKQHLDLYSAVAGQTLGKHLKRSVRV